MAGLMHGVYYAVGIAICCTICSAWSEPTTDDLVQELIQRLERLEAIQRSQQAELAAQKHIIDQQANEIADLKHKCNKQVTDDLSTDTENTGDISQDEAEDNDASLNSSPDGHDVVVGTADVSDKPVRQTIRKRQTPGSRVSFTAYLDHSVDLGLHQTVKFNQIITNEGGAYNNYTGVFTCPVDGVYMFTFTIGQRNVRQTMVELVVNSNPYVNAIVEGFHETQDVMGGNTMIKRLVKGDAVWVDVIFGPHVESNPSSRFTTFSGILVYE